MIKVKVKKENSNISKITIKGHAEYDEKGKDIVCASVSSIVITSVNAIIRIDDKSITYKDLDGFIEINLINCNNDIVNKLIDNMVDLLTELERDYKNYIEIREV